MGKNVLVGFADERIKESFYALRNGKGAELYLYEFLCRAFDDLKRDPACGIKLPRKLWPKEYTKKYGIDNLWKYDLPDGWRLVYTIRANQVLVLVVALEWFDHSGYERRFGYRER